MPSGRDQTTDLLPSRRTILMGGPALIGGTQHPLERRMRSEPAGNETGAAQAISHGGVS